MASAWAIAHGDVRAEPYRDTKGRFEIDLPPGWSLAPRFGDTFGMTFAKPLRTGGEATLTIHVDPVSAPKASELARGVEAQERDAAPAGSRIERKRGRLGRIDAVVVERKSPDKEVRVFCAGAGGRLYLVRTEVPPRGLREVRAEIDDALASFSPGRGEAAARAEAPEPEAKAPQAAVIGRWKTDKGVVLEIGADGRFSLGDLSGNYSADAENLTLRVAGGRTIEFGYALDPDGGRLALVADELKEAIIYKRVGGAAPPAPSPMRDPEGGEDPADDEPAPAPAGAHPSGRWETQAPPVLVLALEAGGAFEMGPLRGRWSAGGGRLTLVSPSGETIVYRFGLEGDRLVLSGGDLDQPLALKKLSGR